MSLQTILQAMEAEAAQEEHRLLSSARAEAEALLADATEQSASIRHSLQEQARAAVHEAAIRAGADADLRVAAHRARARDAQVNRVFALAAERLSRARTDPTYPAALAGLLAEALEAVPVDWAAVARCDPRDLPLLAGLAADAGRSLTLDDSLTTWGGVLVEDVLGRISVDNTLERRLDRAREQLRGRVVATLEDASPGTSPDADGIAVGERELAFVG